MCLINLKWVPPMYLGILPKVCAELLFPLDMYCESGDGSHRIDIIAEIFDITFSKTNIKRH